MPPAPANPAAQAPPAPPPVARSGTRAARSPTTLEDIVELTKPGITKMVLLTTGIGYTTALAAGLSPSATGEAAAWWSLAILGAWCMLGTALSASGANALNQWIERNRDATMRRTCARPLPAGRLDERTGIAVGLGCSVLGVALLWLLVNPAAAVVSATTIVTYVLVYTPLKPVTSLSTIIGSFPGALPPLIGWSAAVPAANAWPALTSGSSAGGWSIFAIMFVWQVPHFLAIAWLYRDDYAKGGHRVLAVRDTSGGQLAAMCSLWLLLLLPVSLMPVVAMPSMLGWGYTLVAIAAWAGFMAASVRFQRTREAHDAKRLFLASIAYLPVALLTLTADAVL